MSCNIYRMFEIRDKNTGEWKAVRGNVIPDFREEDAKVSDVIYLRSCLGWEEYLGNVEGAEKIKKRGWPEDMSRELEYWVNEKYYGRAEFIEPSYYTLSELADLYKEMRAERTKETYRNIMRKAYGMFNKKLDKLLMWASKGKAPKISKKEEEMMFTGYDSSDYDVRLLIEDLEDISIELRYFYFIMSLVHNGWIHGDDIRMVYVYTVD